MLRNSPILSSVYSHIKGPLRKLRLQVSTRLTINRKGEAHRGIGIGEGKGIRGEEYT
jgi:hypothetical protein